MASFYKSKSVKIIAERCLDGVYAWYNYYIAKNGSILKKKKRGCSIAMPLMFDSQKAVKRYIYKNGILKSEKTYIPVEFVEESKVYEMLKKG